MQLRGVIADAVFAHWIHHHVKGNAGFDQAVAEGLGILRMHIVIVGAVH